MVRPNGITVRIDQVFETQQNKKNYLEDQKEGGERKRVKRGENKNQCIIIYLENPLLCSVRTVTYPYDLALDKR